MNKHRRQLLVSSGAVDAVRPTVAITSTETSPTSANPIPLTITFSESVTGFEVGDITVVGCTLANFATADNTVFTVNATPTARSITVDIAEGVCQDAAGNTNTAATQFPMIWEYAEKLADTFTTGIISQLPLWEASGVAAEDYSSNNRDGAYSATGITLGETGIGDGRTSVKLTETGSYVNWYSAGLAGAFNGAEGTIMVWVKVSAAGIWTDGLAHHIVEIRASGTNRININKRTSNGELEFTYLAGGTQEQYRPTGQSATGWLHLAITWSKSNDRVLCFINGSQVGTTMTGLGTWSGAPAAEYTLLGNLQTTQTLAWSGWMAHAVLLSREATPTEVANVASLPFDDPLSVSGGSSIRTFNLASGGDINAACSQMSTGDILNLAAGGTYSLGALADPGTEGFFTLPSGNATYHTTVRGNGATVSGGENGISLAGKSYIDFQDLNIEQARYWSLFCTNSSNLSFTDCDFYNPATTVSFDVCRFDNCSNVTLTRCDAHSTVDVDGTRAHDGFELWGPCSDFTFDSCKAYDIKNGSTVNEGHGFEVYGQAVGQVVSNVTYLNCEAYNCQVGFSCEGGPNSIEHTNIVCDSCDSHDNAFYGYQGVDGATLYRQNLEGTDNTGNGTAETFGSVTDL